MSPSDLFLSPNLTEHQAREYLKSRGFRDPAAADEHLQAIADGPVREAMGELAGPLLDALLRVPDPWWDSRDTSPPAIPGPRSCTTWSTIATRSAC